MNKVLDGFNSFFGIVCWLLCYYFIFQEKSCNLTYQQGYEKKKMLLLFFHSNINVLFKQISRKLGRPNKLQRTYYFQYMHFSKPCDQPRKIVGQHFSIRPFKIPNNVLCTLNNARPSDITQISTCTLTFQPRLTLFSF